MSKQIRQRRKHSAQFKLQIVKELLLWRKTQAQITSEYWVHPSQQNKRKKQFEDNAADIFKDKRTHKSEEQTINGLYQQIGQLSYEVNWLQKKNWNQTWPTMRELVS